MGMRYLQIPFNWKDRDDAPAYAVAFIGGFGDIYLGISCRFCQGFEGFLPGVPFLNSYYHWDGCSLGLLKDDCYKIAHDIDSLLSDHPDMPVVLIGHSYGGSAAMQVARVLRKRRQEPYKLIVLTIDAVSRVQSKKRAEGVLFWGNAYLNEGGGFIDIVPRTGGRWGSTPTADADYAFSGYAFDSNGVLYSHRDPIPMVFDSPGEGKPSLFECVREILANNRN